MRRHARIRAIYRKELIDILRDRRTLLAMIVIPVVLYPLVMLGFVSAAEGEEKRLQAERFVIAVPDEQTRQQFAQMVDDVEKHRGADDDQPFNFEFRPGDVPSEQITRQVHAIARLNIQPPASQLPPHWTIEVIYNEVDIRSRMAKQQLSDLVDRFTELRVRESLASVLTERIGGDARDAVDLILKPVKFDSVSVASDVQRGGWALGQVIPIILVLMTITGAIYPAIDLTAGERERGTLETLMVTPVPIVHLIIGKFLVIATVGLITAMLNVASIGATMHLSGLTQAISQEMPVEFPLSVLPIILVCLVPFALLFSAVLLAVCSFARTFKEAQNYIMPVMVAAMIPAFAVALPSVRLEGAMMVLPVGNMVLLARELFQQTYSWTQIVVVLFSTTLYAAAAIALATKLFGQEAVLFSDSRSYKTLLRREFFVPAEVPHASHSLLLVALLFPAVFYAQSFLTQSVQDNFLRSMSWLAIIQFLGMFMLLPLALAIFLKIDPVETFKVRKPQARAWMGAILIGVSTWAIAAELLRLQQTYLLPPSKALTEFSRQLESQIVTAPLWVALILLAIVPAVAEEFLFRGAVLSGVSNGLRKWSAIVLVAGIFGIFHFILDRVPLTAAMGVVLGYICWQTRSIFPGMLVHAFHNGAMIAISRFPKIQSVLGLDNAESQEGLPAPVLITAIVCFLAGMIIIASCRGTRSKPTAAPLDAEVSIQSI